MPVTVLKLGGCQVVAKRTEETDGYTAVQLGSGFAKPSVSTRPNADISQRLKSSRSEKLAEFRVDGANLLGRGR